MAVIDLKPLTRKEARVITEMADTMRGALAKLKPEDRDTGPMLRTQDVLATLDLALAARASRSPLDRLLAPYTTSDLPHVHTYLSVEVDVMRTVLAR